MSSRNNTSSRNKKEYNTFDPRLDPSDYRAENLDRFILTAGAAAYDKYLDELNRMKAQLLDEYAREKGVDPDKYRNVNVANLRGSEDDEYQRWKKEIAKLHGDGSRRGPYRNALQQFRFDTARDLFDRGMVGSINDVTQSEAANAKIANQISKEEVASKYSSLGESGFISWVKDQIPEGFKTNALEEIARLLKVRGFSTVKGTGDKKKVELYNLIMSKVGGQVKNSTRSPGSTSISSTLRDELERKGIKSAGTLTGMRVDELRNLAKQYGLSSSGRKAELINSIASSAGLGVLRGKEDVAADVDDLINLARNDPIGARERARNLDPNELDQVSLPKMRELYTALRLRKEEPSGTRTGAPSKSHIIALLVGEQSETSRSRESRTLLTSDRDACMDSDLESVQKAARDLRIPTLGLSKSQLCDKIYGYHLARISELILNRGVDLQRIANLSPEEQKTELRRLAPSLQVGRVDSLDELVRKWLRSHYESRALNLYPRRREDVITFIDTGVLPQNDAAVNDLAIIFSDVRRDMSNMSAYDRRQALSALYDRFVNRLNMGGSTGANTFLANLPRFGFATFEEGSPMREYNNGSLSPRSNRQTPLVNDNFNIITSSYEDLRGRGNTPRSPVNGNGSRSPAASSPGNGEIYEDFIL